MSGSFPERVDGTSTRLVTIVSSAILSDFLVQLRVVLGLTLLIVGGARPLAAPSASFHRRRSEDTQSLALEWESARSFPAVRRPRFSKVTLDSPQHTLFLERFTNTRWSELERKSCAFAIASRREARQT